MVGKSKTIPNAQRARVLAEYRSRGRSNRNLWLVYSVKTDRDWILPSDKHFLLWLAFLESDATVRAFRIIDQNGIKGKHSTTLPRVDAVATYRDGTIESHIIARKGHKVEEQSDYVSACQELYGSSTFRVVTDEDLRRCAAKAMRWLKVVCFAAPLRGRELTAETLAIVTRLRSLGSGKVADIAQCLVDFDRPTVIGIIARAAILGDISLDLNPAGFTLRSQWTWRNRECAGPDQ